MSKAIEKKESSVSKLDAERQRMKNALAQLNLFVEAEPVRPSGRLVFALDLTASREPCIKSARAATAAMFEGLKSIGRIAMKLVYFRGTSECRASEWYEDPAPLIYSMRRLSCVLGGTQIGSVLRLVQRLPEPASAVVYIGDCCEEDPGELIALAKDLGARGIPIFVFHECADWSTSALEAMPVFQKMAAASGGIYCAFGSESAAALKEMLASVAALAAAGREGLRRMALPETPEAKRLRNGLLQLGSAVNLDSRK